MFPPKLISFFSVVSITGLLVACGNKSADDAKQETANVVAAETNPAIKSGTFATQCASSTIPDMGSLKFPGTRTIYEISSLEFKKREIFYTDGECKHEAYAIAETGKIKVTEKSKSDKDPLSVDFNFDHTTVTVGDANVLKAFNLLNVCDAKDWTAGNAKDVSKQAAGLKCPGKASPRTAPEMVLVEGNKLYLGANTDRTPDKGRPSNVDRTKSFDKM